MPPERHHALRDRCSVVGSTCACFAIRKASRAVTQLYDTVLQPSGLRVTQVTLLVALSLAGSVPVSRLGKTLIMDRTTLTRNLRPLLRQRLVAVGPGRDRRVRTVSLTARGREKLARALPLWEQAQAHVVRRLGAGRWNSLQADLSALVALARPE